MPLTHTMHSRIRTAPRATLGFLAPLAIASCASEVRYSWPEARAAPTVVAYRRFRAENPGSPHVVEARGKITEIARPAEDARQEEAHFAKATSPTASGKDITTYLERFPQSPRANDVREKLPKAQARDRARRRFRPRSTFS